MTYNVSSETLNPTVPYHTIYSETAWHIYVFTAAPTKYAIFLQEMLS